MSIRHTAVAQLRATPGRFVAVTVAILIGTAFISATGVFSATFRAAVADAAAAQYRTADVVVVPDGDATYDPAAANILVDDVRAVPGVSAVAPVADNFGAYTAEGSRGWLRARSLPDDPALRWTTLSSGRWPSGDDEILLTRDTADRGNLPVGGTLTVEGWPVPSASTDAAATARATPRTTFTVVGLVDAVGSPGGANVGYVTAAALEALFPRTTPSFLLVTGGGDADALAQSIGAATSGSATVETAAAASATAAQVAEQQVRVLGDVLTGFAVVAIVVAMIVIATTFTTLIAQRRRQIGLLRCVGATREQVRTQVLLEAAVLGAIGGVLGVGIGVAGGFGVARFFGVSTGGLAVDGVGLVVTAIAAVVVTVVAAWVPSAAAMRVAPLAALRPVDSDAASAARQSRVRVVVALVLAVPGLVALVHGATAGRFELALLGGAATAAGVLLLSRTFLPPLIAALGSVGRLAGVPGRMAAGNLLRNPGRTASSGTALMVGVGLIVTLLVGSASAAATLDRELAERYPVDLTLSAADGALGTQAPSLVARLAAVPGMGDVVTLPGAAATLSVSVGGQDLAEPVTVLGAPAGGVPAPVQPAPGEVLIDLEYWGIEGPVEGVTARLTAPDGTTTAALAVRQAPVGLAGTQNGASVVVAASTLNLLSATAPATVVWATIADQSRSTEIVAEVNRLTVGENGIQVGGAAPIRTDQQKGLSQILTFAIGLLAVAVVIAVVGIANTLSLSVVERTRESGLLRALGLQRGQLRRMLAIEAVLLAVAGTLVGVLAGILFGWAGASAVITTAGEALVMDLPWGQILAVLGGAVVAGLLASVLPARRAARTAPVAALVDVG
ncbi:FtsX-like permease family protein [Nakamurella flava]|uniref:FtsX-like permease family protein n=1 Tax=Nakamurella flava TaxID=2576308 RepID=A0A4V6CRA8_9ACTN|nr:FtsX-like permease family protein [Nakamurella flava]TKV56785.1 FtsX-like permease family protein [Nakamurella flava]